MTGLELHPIVAAAALGQLPAWACVRPERMPHLESVAGLLSRWAEALGLDERDRQRWAAAGRLHDCLRDADPQLLSTDAGDYPAKVRHGPAAAARLEAEGVNDEELAEAIRYHTLGRPGWGKLGRFLFMADYLEETREFDSDERADLRARMPLEHEAVMRVVCARRIAWRLDDGASLHPLTVELWNELVEGT
jgi:2-amino-4-hydroxy-6-hydroxymethyldihydropteridine diphosphokinase